MNWRNAVGLKNEPAPAVSEEIATQFQPKTEQLDLDTSSGDTDQGRYRQLKLPFEQSFYDELAAAFEAELNRQLELISQLHEEGIVSFLEGGPKPCPRFSQKRLDFETPELEVVAPSTPPNRIYSARELVRRVEEPGPFHNFPESFNENIFAGNRRVIRPDYVQYELRGSITVPGDPIRGRGSVVIGGERIQPIVGYTPSTVYAGTFEIGVKPSASGRTEVIVHRFFRKD